MLEKIPGGERNCARYYSELIVLMCYEGQAISHNGPQPL